MGIDFTEHYSKEDGYTGLHRYTHGVMCFGNVHWGEIRGITYHAKVSKDLTQAQARWWVRNVRGLLAGGGLRYTVSPRSLRRIDFRLLGLEQDEDDYLPLLYLTAFRYLEYFPLIVRLMYRHRIKARGRAAFLRLLQQVSIDVQNGKGQYHDRIAAAHYMGDHDLVSPMKQYGTSADKPISLARFKRNLRVGRGGVQAYFS